jgi:hypothetical protein
MVWSGRDPTCGSPPGVTGLQTVFLLGGGGYLSHEGNYGINTFVFKLSISEPSKRYFGNKTVDTAWDSDFIF